MSISQLERNFLTVLAAKNAPPDCAIAALNFLRDNTSAMLTMVNGLMGYETVNRPEVMKELTLAMIEHGIIESDKTVEQIRADLRAKETISVS
jgi:hypothetical protein